MEDCIDNYTLRIDGYKRYKCEICDYLGKQRKDMADHILGKKHKELFNKKSAVSIPIPIPVKEENINLIISPKNSPPKNKLKGKTFLSTYCADALKLDISLPYLERYGRQVVYDNDDIQKWGYMKANEFLVHIFLKLIKKEGGINNFFLRCVDTNRKRFFYNDANVGWTEDLMNSVTICLIRQLLSNLNGTAIDHYKKLGHSPSEKNNERCMLFMLWGRDRESMEESVYKSKKEGERELNEGLTLLSKLLQVEEDD